MTDAIKGLIEALKVWKCAPCGGRGKTGGEWPRFDHEPCGSCAGTGQHPTARAALEAFAQRSPLRDDAVLINNLNFRYGVNLDVARHVIGLVEAAILGPRTPAKEE